MAAYDPNNVFARILRGELPCKKVYEDEFAFAFHDIQPKAEVHVLVIPKGAYVSLADFSATAPDAMVAGFWRAVGRVARELGVEERGYRIASNIGREAGQIVFHFHVHIVSGARRP
ncbi:MAG: histidine triad nucleotide-binding protein [Alphaproteobacteria bacterium]|nr:histidine triad nucleotide-binding protein [Alphaproteobacteria bacterium]